MKARVVYAALLLVGLVIVLGTLAATPARAENCAGQGHLYNNGPYIAEIVSINDPKWHQDIAPWKDAIYHVDFNQPVKFMLYRAGYLEKYLASTEVLAGCNFADEQRVVISGSRLESITYPGGFAPYFPWYDAGW